MKRVLLISLAAVFAAQAAVAEIALVESRALERHFETQAQKRAAERAQRQQRHARRGNRNGIAEKSLGSIALSDASSLRWFLDTDTTSAGSNASGAVGEAFYATSNQTISGTANVAVAATTSGGSFFFMPLNDAFDGYNALCINGVCGNQGGKGRGVSGTPYTNNGPPTSECGGRQYVFNPQVVGSLTVFRKFFVPSNDTFARWLDVVTNTGATPQNVLLSTVNNLGSDLATRIDATSSGDTTVDTADTWATSFQNYDNNGQSTDVRLGHVFQGPGAPVGLSAINFVDGDDLPSWQYSFSLAPGATAIIMNFATGQPSRVLAQDKSAELAGLSPNSLQCMTPAEISEVVNFLIPADLSLTKTASAPTVTGGSNVDYTLTVTNNGPNRANGVTVTDTLPAGVTFVSATGTGWTCGEAAGVVTCTLPFLDPGTAPTITIRVTTPQADASLVNSATVSSTQTDPNGGNNAATATVTVQAAIAQVPTLSELGLAVLSLLLLTAGLRTLRGRRA
ncbi:MAG TPA: DUF11 domain-containing protein [Thermoanaerobaculia bacterium]|nr:DUF11 domain-containing protein [Thermoanaerobaculia bacterium]